MAAQSKQEKLKKLKMHEAYEEYVENILKIIQKKTELITDFRIKKGKEKLDRLRRELSNG